MNAFLVWFFHYPLALYIRLRYGKQPEQPKQRDTLVSPRGPTETGDSGFKPRKPEEYLQIGNWCQSYHCTNCDYNCGEYVDLCPNCGVTPGRDMIGEMSYIATRRKLYRDVVLRGNVKLREYK